MNDLIDEAAAAKSCFEIPSDWGGLTANQDGPYYDIWALRHPRLVPR